MRGLLLDLFLPLFFLKNFCFVLVQPPLQQGMTVAVNKMAIQVEEVVVKMKQRQQQRGNNNAATAMQ